ncbi:branched-chain amino acid ABC transporter substrate-binding protein [Frigidibacter albus]|uniref:Branched-chain amino acid ABC transporter substrate-binding protein n=1 Tax=Frigidibacter albus TaxID=1465486 RepID=A0A6L8VF24_9RHOB|nr:ABC transporter substrate-binding protein [Frigidibacter albus]MZQ88833.1 branched-chain amino acid ABC transporter substrate-binding protein [Frigidibacter albus]NBE30358.1 branched-chain amino acid ABC transporter substrate-binding protein [Frigidibacter albus]GGH50761.1 ABC transporter substrate-binding protein [Frigidibacter albus]
MGKTGLRLAGALLACAALSAPAQAQTEYRAAVLRVDTPGPLPISRLDLPPEDLGFAGGALGTADNATTGSFMKQTFVTEDVLATPETAEAEMQRLLDGGTRFIVVLADEAMTVRLADLAGDRALLFNAGASGDVLRNADCRANLLHTAPSDAMLADALAQFLIWKRWDEWFLIEGIHPEDTALAGAYRRAATKFGAKIVEERVFEDTGGARRTDSGHVQVQAQMPVFTQRAAEHDVVVAADHAGVFAAWLPFHTWEPRPVAGSGGLMPVSWHPAHEAWGAMQWQTRFEKQNNRPARPEDFQVWMALRSLGEAATRTTSDDFDTLVGFITGDSFDLAAFKGQKLTYRDWDGQLRQPVLLSMGPVTVSVSPQDGFLHQVSQLDTLGTDRAETGCTRMTARED